MDNDTLTSSTVTMSSLEIAELTGKKHKHVLEDIRKMLISLNIQPADLLADYKDARGRTFQCFNLPRKEVDILVSGYSLDYRAKIVERWHFLEKQSRNVSTNISPFTGFTNAVVSQFDNIKTLVV